MGFDDRDLARRAGGFSLGLVRVADDDVDAGQAFVQLKGRRHRPGHEPEVFAYALGQGLRRQPEREHVRHALVDDRRKFTEQFPVFR